MIIMSDSTQHLARRYRRIHFAGKRELFWLLLHVVFMLILSMSTEGIKQFAVPLGSLALAVILISGAYSQVRQSSLMIWSPLVWFRAATAVFFGLGNVLPYVANDATVLQIRGLFDFTNDQALTVVLLTSGSVLITLTVARAFFISVLTEEQLSIALISRDKLRSIALLFLILGGSIRYGVVLPQLFGWSENTIPGWLNALSASYAAGLFLALLWGLRYSRPMLFVVLVLVSVDVAMGALAFDKSEMVLTLIFSYMAFLFHRFNVMRAVAGAIAVLSVIYFAQSPAHYGRLFLEQSASENVSIFGRLSIITQYIDEGDTLTRWAGGDLNPLMRVSYLAPAAFVVNEYDEGRSGNAHQHAAAALVPRILWPNKPIIGAAGGEIFQLIRGRDGASVGVGHFAEAYWSFGWAGLLIVFLPSGLILAIISYFSLSLVKRERWLRLPVVLYGINIGYKVSGSWVPGVVGAFATYLVLAAIFFLIERFAESFSSRKRSCS